jgi:acetolactate synthase-1/2/3 large subunit
MNTVDRAQVTGATAICAIAAECGVDVCFANPGTSEMHVVGALNAASRAPNPIRSVLCLHENVCTGAADAYSRIKGESGAMAMTLLHLGPGLMNGLSNLHNANKGRSCVLNVVGEMSTFHRGAGALLESDIVALAQTVSGDFVYSAALPNSIPEELVDAAIAANARNVATLVVPHDRTWEEVSAEAIESALKRARTTFNVSRAPVPVDEGTRGFLKQMIARAADVRQKGGKFLFYLGGNSCREPSIRTMGKIADALGADVMCECFFTAIDRGGDLPRVKRCPYLPQDARATFSKYVDIALVDCPKPPVSMFGYQDTPSSLMPQGEDNLWVLDPSKLAIADVIRACAEEVEAFTGKSFVSDKPNVNVFERVDAMISEILGNVTIEDKEESLWNCGLSSRTALQVHERLSKEFGVTLNTTVAFNYSSIKTLTEHIESKLGIDSSSCPPPGVTTTTVTPADTDASEITGALTGDKVCKLVARAQPPGSIIVDESLTSGGAYWDASAHSPQFTHITLTGGSIGFANAAAVGAALAAPREQVISLIGDGSASYTVQALWTQARERLNVVSIIMNNGSYQILRVEMAMQGIAAGKVSNALTDLSAPNIDWVKLAEGYGVRGVRAATAEEFQTALRDCLAMDGPSVIDAVLADV